MNLDDRMALRSYRRSRLQVERRDDEFTHRHDQNAAPDAGGVKDERLSLVILSEVEESSDVRRENCGLFVILKG